MISSIGSANFSSASTLGVNNSGMKLTSLTKKKLEALGIDTTKIKTEAEGQKLLKEAEAVAKSAHSKENKKDDQVDQVKSMSAMSGLNNLALLNKLYLNIS